MKMAEVNKDKYTQALTVLRQEKFGQAYEQTLPMTMRRYMPVDKAVNIVGRAIQKNPKLLACDIRTIQQSMIDCAALGLELAGPLNQAHLVPFWNSKKNNSDAVLIIGFGGYLELMRRTGEFDGAPLVQWVYSNDTKKVDIASRDPIMHTPCLDGDRGHPLFVYILCWFKTGGRFFDFRTYEQIIQHRDRYIRKDKYGNWPGPWDEKKNLPEFLEMGKKTLIRLSQKHLPKNTEMALAAEYEANVEMGQPQAIVQWADMPDSDNGELPASRAEQTVAALKSANPGSPPTEEKSKSTTKKGKQASPPKTKETTPPKSEDNPPESKGDWAAGEDEVKDLPIDEIKKQALKAGMDEDTFIHIKTDVGIDDGKPGTDNEAKRKKLIFEIRTWLDTMPMDKE